MGLLSDIGDAFGEVTGFGSNGNPNPHVLDDAAYEDYYNKAINAVSGAGGGTAAERGQIQNILSGQLGQLENNAAGRKKNYEEDMARSFGNDVQSRARSAGGTGNLAQALSPTGSMYDSEARALSRGYNDLYSQATKDLGSLQGVQGNLNAQDFQRANATAGLNMQRINQRTGIATGNVGRQMDSEDTGATRRYDTISGAAKAAGIKGF